MVPLAGKLKVALGGVGRVLHHVAAGAETDVALLRGHNGAVDERIEPGRTGEKVATAQCFHMGGISDVRGGQPDDASGARIHFGEVVHHPVPGHGRVAAHGHAVAIGDAVGGGATGRGDSDGGVGEASTVMGDGADILRCRIELPTITVQVDELRRLENHRRGLSNFMDSRGRDQPVAVGLGGNRRLHRSPTDLDAVDRVLGMGASSAGSDDRPPDLVGGGDVGYRSTKDDALVLDGDG